MFFVARYRASSKQHRFCTNVHFSDNTTGTGCQWKYVLQRGENNKTSFCNVQIFLQVLLLEAAVMYFVVFVSLQLRFFRARYIHCKSFTSHFTFYKKRNMYTVSIGTFFNFSILRYLTIVVSKLKDSFVCVYRTKRRGLFADISCVVKRQFHVCN